MKKSTVGALFSMSAGFALLAGSLANTALASGLLEPQPATQPGASLPQPIHLTRQEDHARVMQVLGITTIRHGGEVQKLPDEATANPYPQLPDPLLFTGGTKVTTPDQWWRRRQEIVEDFDREVYGRVPANVPAITWTLTNSAPSTVMANGKSVAVVTKTLRGHVDNSACPAISVNIGLVLTLPVNAAGPSPVMLILTAPGYGFPISGTGFGRMGQTRANATAPAGGRDAPGNSAETPHEKPTTNPAASEPEAAPFRSGFSDGSMGLQPWEQDVLRKGWGYAMLNTSSIQADGGEGLTQGIIGLCNKGQPRSVDDWGALRAWAWGASRALDYLHTDHAVDAAHVGLEGHSRWGKAAIVAMAYDQRFAVAYVSSSGEGGAKLNRRNAGELVENIAGSGEYHWMAENFMKYAADPLHSNDLPVDSHELIAMCAPRPVFIGCGAIRLSKGDAWVDPVGMFMAAAAAQPVYALLGKKTMGTDKFPGMNAGLIDGEIAYRQHDQGHTDAPNWPYFLTFADRYIKGPGLKDVPATQPASH